MKLLLQAAVIPLVLFLFTSCQKTPDSGKAAGAPQPAPKPQQDDKDKPVQTKYRLKSNCTGETVRKIENKDAEALFVKTTTVTSNDRAIITLGRDADGTRHYTYRGGYSQVKTFVYLNPDLSASTRTPPPPRRVEYDSNGKFEQNVTEVGKFQFKLRNLTEALQVGKNGYKFKVGKDEVDKRDYKFEYELVFFEDATETYEISIVANGEKDDPAPGVYLYEEKILSPTTTSRKDTLKAPVMEYETDGQKSTLLSETTTCNSERTPL